MFTGITQETLDTVSQFTLLWNVFERKFYNRRCGERAVFDGKDINFSNVTVEKSEELRSYLLNEGKTASNTLSRLHFNNGNLRSMILDWFENDKFSSKAVVGVIFRIRCNTFHGNKTAFIVQSQIEMFKNINEILICILQSNNLTLAD